MVRFLFGFVAAVVIVLLTMLCCVRFGFVDPRADAEVGVFESKIAMPALDAAVERRAPNVANPIQPTDENLMTGMRTYQNICAGCHGDILHLHAAFGDAFHPRAPQFAEDAPDMPENQNFYIIQHGVRLSGMPAWKQALTDLQTWQLVTFLSDMDKLPPQVSAAWKAAASDGFGSAGANPSSDTTKTKMKEEKNMEMSA